MQTLKVYPNPFAAFDKNGVPCGVCPRDPDADAGGPGHFVGARLDTVNTKILQDFRAMNARRYGAAMGAALAAHEIRSPIQATFYEYMGVPSCDPELAEKLAGKDAVELPVTKYYKDRLREGSLLAADAATAKAAALPIFTDPKLFFAARQATRDAAVSELEGVTLPADGVERAVEITSDTDTKPAKASKKPAQETSP
jgi:hypothetical protein